jgi:hypothetical protein
MVSPSNRKNKSVFFRLNPWPILLLCLSLTSTSAQKTRPIDQLNDLVHREVGSKANVADGQYLQGDFNGDGFADMAIAVFVDDAREELRQHGVRYVDTDPWGKRNGRQLDVVTGLGEWRNCVGVVFLHGSAKSWNPAAISDKYLMYDCFSNFHPVPHGRRIGRGNGSVGPTPKPRGDSILLDLESGATALIYWNGRTYRGFGIRGGD